LFEEGRRTGTLLLWAISFLSLLVSISLTNWLPIILDQAGLGIGLAVINSVVLSGGGMLGALFFATLADRLDAYKVLVPAYITGAIFVGSIGIVPATGILLTIIVFFANFFFIGAQMFLPSLIAFYYPGPLRASGIGWTMGVGRMGAILGPMLAGVLLAWSVAPRTLFASAAIVTLLAAAAVGAMGFLYGRQSTSTSAVSQKSLSA
jgi:AAHS family 4-hydroxybenzoate transporter-like MFS transporter